MRIIHRLFPLWVTLGLVIPAGIGWLVGGTFRERSPRSSGPASRMFLVHHVTFSINSICHFFDAGASRPRTAPRTSSGSRSPIRRVLAPQPPRLPRSAMHGLRWWRSTRRRGDPGDEAPRLAWNVVMITPERQQQRMQEPRPARCARRARS